MQNTSKMTVKDMTLHEIWCLLIPEKETEISCVFKSFTGVIPRVPENETKWHHCNYCRGYCS